MRGESEELVGVGLTTLLDNLDLRNDTSPYYYIRNLAT